MTKVVEDIVAKAVRLTGLAAWTAEVPGSQPMGQCLADWVWMDQVRALVAEVKTAFPLLRSHGIDSDCMCWVHERARVYVAPGNKDCFLVLVVENRPGIPLAAYENLLRQFAGA